VEGARSLHLQKFTLLTWLQYGDVHSEGFAMVVKREYIMPVWRNETECADLRRVGGYWNDND
jgi:hypothetical protein